MSILRTEHSDGIHQENPVANPPRFERKFYLPSSKIPFARHLLVHCCRRDRQYPEGIVNSVYYDTSDLEFFCDSVDGNYIRNKVRIRWYDGPQQKCETTHVYMELKSKNGYAGSKQRKMHLVPSGHLNNGGMQNGLIDYTTLRQGLAQFDYFPKKCLQPVILISYNRLRFEDILTGSRVSLDWNIRSILVSPQLNRQEGSLLMRGGVIEIKGQSTDIPPALQSIRHLGTDWSRYSKYAACMESQLDTPGSVGRFWPSGRVEEF
jgi:hypothetical protein